MLRNMSLWAHSENPSRAGFRGERIDTNDQNWLTCNAAALDFLYIVGIQCSPPQMIKFKAMADGSEQLIIVIIDCEAGR